MRGWRYGYWRGADDFRELDGLPEERRQALWKAAYKGAWNTKLVWATYLFTIPLLIALQSIAAWATAEGYGINGVSNGMIASALWGGLMGLITWQAIRYVMERRLHRMLPHLCSACGYDLTANTSGVCPECGRQIRNERTADEKASPSGP